MNGNQKFERQEVKRPLGRGWVPIGEKKSVNWTLWDNNVTFERREKTNGDWNTTEQFHMPASVIKEIIWRAGNWLTEMEAEKTRIEKE